MNDLQPIDSLLISKIQSEPDKRKSLAILVNAFFPSEDQITAVGISDALIEELLINPVLEGDLFAKISLDKVGKPILNTYSIESVGDSVIKNIAK